MVILCGICEVYLGKCGLCVNCDVYLESVNYIYILRTNPVFIVLVEKWSAFRSYKVEIANRMTEIG